MNLESKLAGINLYYTTHLTFILETVASTMQFWGFTINFMDDGSIKAIKDKSRLFPFLYQDPNIETKARNKLKKIDIQINQKPETIKNHILKMGLISFFSLFEAFNKDYFHELYMFKPDLMKSKKKKVDLEYLLQFKKLSDLHKSLSQIQVEKFGYYDIDKIAKLFLKKFNINLKDNLVCWPSLRESYYRRNCIVHNDGKISEIYLEKMSLGLDKLNEELNCNIEYVWKCHYDLQSYMDFIDNSIRKLFKLKDIVDSL